MPYLPARSAAAVRRAASALSLMAAAAASPVALAQAPEVPANVVSLSASGHLAVPQD